MSANQPFSIRKAVPADGPGILTCLRVAFAPYENDYPSSALLDTVLTPETLQQRFTFMNIYVAVLPDGQIIGTIGCHVRQAGEGHFRGMAVLPEWQGSGVATQLLQTVEADLKARNCTRITLDTTNPLQRAVRFYERHGYRRSGVVGDYSGMPLHELVKFLE
jgi:ribosomal protein S18 acetylase RimI-like enzyme